MSYNLKADSTSVADNTTVVGGPLSHIGDPAYLSESYPRKASTGGKAVHLAHDMPPRTFLETAQYTDVERPFFVPIGKDGLISALQKLDTQLRNVSVLPSCSVESKELKGCLNTVRKDAPLVEQGREIDLVVVAVTGPTFAS